VSINPYAHPHWKLQGGPKTGLIRWLSPHCTLRNMSFSNIHNPRPKKTIIEGSLDVKLPTIWTDEKLSRAEAEGREKIRREKSRRERVRRKKTQMREKVGKSRNTVVSNDLCLRRVEQ